MKRLLLVPSLVLSLAILLPQSTGAQGLIVVAVPDFIDESADGVLIQAGGLSLLLQRLLAEQGGARLRVVAGEPVQAALRDRRLTIHDLISPSRASDVAMTLGAHWIITGRWTSMGMAVLPPDQPPSPGVPVFREALAYALLEIRVVETASRRILFERSFAGSALGRPGRHLLLSAAEEALRAAAALIARL